MSEILTDERRKVSAGLLLLAILVAVWLLSLDTNQDAELHHQHDACVKAQLSRPDNWLTPAGAENACWE